VPTGDKFSTSDPWCPVLPYLMLMMIMMLTSMMKFIVGLPLRSPEMRGVNLQI